MKIIYQIWRFDNPKGAQKEFFITRFNDEVAAFSEKSDLSGLISSFLQNFCYWLF